MLLPLASAWAEEQERNILRDGVLLSHGQIADAIKIGVGDPGRVRHLKMPSIPIPGNPAAEATQHISSRTRGLTVRHGIFIRANCWGDHRVSC